MSMADKEEWQNKVEKEEVQGQESYSADSGKQK